MLRTIFVLMLALFGAYYAAQSAFYGLLFYLWIAYFRPESWVWFGIVQSLNLSLIAGVYLLLRAPFSGSRFRMDARSLLLLLFLLLTVVSTAASDYSSLDKPSFQDFVKVLVVTYLLSVLADTPAKIRLVFVVIALSLGFESAKQGWATLILRPGGKNANAVVNLGDENEVAVGLLMLTPFLLALAQTSARRWEKQLHRFLGVGIAYRAISTYSRGGFISAGAMALVYVARTKHKIRSAIAIAAIAGAIFAVLPSEFWDRMNTIKTDETQLESSAASRLHFWRVATRIANTHPVLGVGQFGFQEAYDDYDFSRGAYGRKRAVHSSWFGVFADFGYTGLALFAAIFGMAFIAAEQVIRLAKRGKAPAELQNYGVAVQTGLAVFALGGAFITFHYIEIYWHIVGISMALRNVATSAAAAQAPGTPTEAHPLNSQFRANVRRSA